MFRTVEYIGSLSHSEYEALRDMVRNARNSLHKVAASTSRTVEKLTQADLDTNILAAREKELGITTRTVYVKLENNEGETKYDLIQMADFLYRPSLYAELFYHLTDMTDIRHNQQYSENDKRAWFVADIRGRKIQEKA